MGKNKHGKKKVVLRNVEVCASKTQANVVKANAKEKAVNQALKSIMKPPEPGAQQEVEKSANNAECKYALPELFSTLAVSKKIEKVKNTQPVPITSAAQLTPKSKKQLNTKITKKLNHKHDSTVYARLPPIEVIDDLPPAKESRPKYQPTGKKDPEPKLSDYLYALRRHVPNFNLLITGNTSALERMENFENIKAGMRDTTEMEGGTKR